MMPLVVLVSLNVDVTDRTEEPFLLTTIALPFIVIVILSPGEQGVEYVPNVLIVPPLFSVSFVMSARR